jgi:hypothetical protein
MVDMNKDQRAVSEPDADHGGQEWSIRFVQDFRRIIGKL